MFASPLLKPLHPVLQSGNDGKDQWTTVRNNAALTFGDCNLHSITFLFYIPWNIFSPDLHVQWCEEGLKCEMWYNLRNRFVWGKEGIF